LKRWALRKINHQLVRVNDDWEEILAKKFFKVLENNDLRHILKRYVINYDQSRLIDAYEKIMNQYEEGINDKGYTHHLRGVSEDLKKHNLITKMQICYLLLKIDEKTAIKELRLIGIM